MKKISDQKTLETKIHQFMARKSSWKTFSKTIAEFLTPSARSKDLDDSDLSFEPMKWQHTGPMSESRLQKAL